MASDARYRAVRGQFLSVCLQPCLEVNPKCTYTLQDAHFDWTRGAPDIVFDSGVPATCLSCRLTMTDM